MLCGPQKSNAINYEYKHSQTNSSAQESPKTQFQGHPPNYVLNMTGNVEIQNVNVGDLHMF